MKHRSTKATPAFIPRGRAKFTRRERLGPRDKASGRLRGLILVRMHPSVSPWMFLGAAVCWDSARSTVQKPSTENYERFAGVVAQPECQPSNPNYIRIWALRCATLDEHGSMYINVVNRTPRVSGFLVHKGAA